VSFSVFVDVAASAVDTVESVVAVTEAETAVDVSGINAVAVEITVVFAEIFIYVYFTELDVEPTSYRKMAIFSCVIFVLVASSCNSAIIWGSVGVTHLL
jgi:hypothetical protein